MTIAEIVSELLFADKTLPEIAGLDDAQMRYVVFRRRDNSGRLIRVHGGLPPGVEVDEKGQRIVTNPISLQEAFYRSGREKGLRREQVEAEWEAFREANPKMGKSAF